MMASGTCPMMGGGMMGMGQMGGGAQSLQMRGEMMKAMGEVMLKHAQAMEQEK